VTSADVRLSVGKRLEIVNMFLSKTKECRFEQPKLLGIWLLLEIRDSASPTRGPKWL